MSEQTQKQATPADQPSLLPPVDVFEDDEGITLYADLPGVPKDRLQLNVEGETLILDGEIALDMPKGLEATHVEVAFARYHRVFTLSKELDTEHLKADLKQGVLKLRIPRAERARARKIPVTAE
jgi:HSP20 family protein